MATATQLLTAAEYAQMPDPGYPTELVEGEIVEMNMPSPRHGQVCGNTYFQLRDYLKERRLGHVVTNDAGILTRRDPDTVRGGDVWYVSYDKVPAGPLPERYLETSPDIVFEVLSPTDRRSQVLRKVSEYLEAGVAVVCVLDPESETAHLYSEAQERTLASDEELTFPDQLPGFRVLVRTLFE